MICWSRVSSWEERGGVVSSSAAYWTFAPYAGVAHACGACWARVGAGCCKVVRARDT